MDQEPKKPDPVIMVGYVALLIAVGVLFWVWKF